MRNNIDVSELLLHENINIIDIRSKELFMSGSITNAINIPKNVLLSNYQKYLNKDDIYYMLCNTGLNSARVVDFLNKLGYHTINILGGYEAYRQLNK